jgi:hypothetical protein
MKEAKNGEEFGGPLGNSFFLYFSPASSHRSA